MTNDHAAQLRRWALEPMKVRTRPDWTRGFGAALFFLLALAVVSMNDARIAERDRADAAETAGMRLRAELDEANNAPQVRIHAGGYKCQAMHVRSEWALAIGKECERLAGVLRAARATP